MSCKDKLDLGKRIREALRMAQARRNLTVLGNPPMVLGHPPRCASSGAQDVAPGFARDGHLGASQGKSLNPQPYQKGKVVKSQTLLGGCFGNATVHLALSLNAAASPSLGN